MPNSSVVNLSVIHSPARRRCSDFYQFYARFMYLRNDSMMFNAISTHDAISAHARILHSASPRRRYNWKYIACKTAVNVASIVLSLRVIILNTSLKSHYLRWRPFFQEMVTIECFRSPSAVEALTLTCE